jgi:hypothetical protein
VPQFQSAQFGFLLTFALLSLDLSNLAVAGGHRRCKPRRSYCHQQAYQPQTTVSRHPSGAASQPRVAARSAPTRGVFISKSGARYAYVEVDEPGTEEKLRQEHLRNPLSPAARLFASNSSNFAGHDRMAAKTSIAEAPVEDLGNLDAVLGSLPKDAAMLSHDPAITEDPDSDRVTEEERNVHIRAFLYATKREADNDYHLILGSASDANESRFMTAEISGLPETGPARAVLTVPRQAFEGFFETNRIGTMYKKFNPPIPVDVTGSLFFDLDHPAGAVGPTGLKPETAWEIHPVTSIVLEP